MSEVRPLRAYAEVALGRQRSPQHEDGPHMVPYLRAANVKDGTLDLTDVKEMNFSPAEQAIFSLAPGDVLVTEGSGSLGTVGASAVWRGEIEGTVCFQNTLLRLRPRTGTDSRFLAWWCRYAFSDGLFASVATGANIFHLSADRARGLPVSRVESDRQRAIADFLDAETARIDALIAKKRRLLAVLNDRIDAEIMEWVGHSELARPGSGDRAAPIKRLLIKLSRPARVVDMVTAYRDGQVTARSLRRAEGYTDAWTDGAHVQGVARDDVVVHGLDAFSGAVGWSEADGVCSPIYHVCLPADGGSPLFYARLLRVFAVSGYLELFATSTRERAVDLRNWDLFGRIPIPVVPLAVQHRIGERIRKLVPMKVAVDRSADLAAEHRQALITAAVTGELDVPGVAA